MIYESSNSNSRRESGKGELSPESRSTEGPNVNWRTANTVTAECDEWAEAVYEECCGILPRKRAHRAQGNVVVLGMQRHSLF